ncbi:YHYH domain-containing protein [Methylotenera sp. G11]
MKYALIVLAFAFSLSAVAHSGRTDANGCHHDRKTGGYHCH